MAAGRAVVPPGAAGPAACGSREQPPQASPAAASSPRGPAGGAASHRRPGRGGARRLRRSRRAGRGPAGARAGCRAGRLVPRRPGRRRAGAMPGGASWASRRRGPGLPAGSQAAPAGPWGLVPGAAVATGTPGICAAEAASRMPGGGGPASRACSAASRARAAQPEQDGGGDAGAGGEGGVPGELGDDPAQRLGAGVVLEEEVDGGGRLAGELLGPAAVPVGAGVAAPGGGAAPLAPPAFQRLPAAAGAGGGGQRGEDPVRPGVVGEAGRQGDRHGPVAAVAEVGGGDAVLGGEQHRAGLVQDEVQRGRPGGGEGPEPVDGPVLVQGRHPGGGGAGGAEGELGDLAGGQDAVLADHAQQPPVAGGEPGGQLGGQLRAAGQPPAGAGAAGPGVVGRHGVSSSGFETAGSGAAAQPGVGSGGPGRRGGAGRAGGRAVGGAGRLAHQPCPARDRRRERPGPEGEGGRLGAAGDEPGGGLVGVQVGQVVGAQHRGGVVLQVPGVLGATR